MKIVVDHCQNPCIIDSVVWEKKEIDMGFETVVLDAVAVDVVVLDVGAAVVVSDWLLFPHHLKSHLPLMSKQIDRNNPETMGENLAEK